MLLLTTIAVSLLLAVSAKVETKAAVRTVAEDLANAKATTIVDSNHRLQAKMTKAHDQMIAKFSASKNDSPFSLLDDQHCSFYCLLTFFFFVQCMSPRNTSRLWVPWRP